MRQMQEFLTWTPSDKDPERVDAYRFESAAAVAGVDVGALTYVQDSNGVTRCFTRRPGTIREFEPVYLDMLDVVMSGVRVDDERTEMVFENEARDFRWTFYHRQDCCERVLIEDITGDLNDLVGSRIVQAEDVSGSTAMPDVPLGIDEAAQWTFYKFATAKGYVTVRWFGASNYYSTEVNLLRERLDENGTWIEVD